MSLSNSPCHKKFLFLFFILFITTPIVLSLYGVIGHKKIDLSLSGYFDNVSKPTLSKENYLNRKFQNDFENYFSKKFTPRGFLIKIYNQIQFDIFRKGQGVIGKNDYLYLYEYIADECGFDLASHRLFGTRDYDSLTKENEMKNYIEHLVSIDKKLNIIGKKLLIYTTPSKANVYRKNIPNKYLWRAKKGTSDIECFKELIKTTNLNYLDTDIFADGMDYPIFYPAGIHWARPIEQKTSAEIVNRIKALTGKNIATIQLGEIKKSKTPYWRDTDLNSLNNLLFKKKWANEYYEYDMKITEPENTDGIVVLAQGGSFQEGLLSDYFGFGNNNAPSNRVYYNIFYLLAFRSKKTNYSIQRDFKNLNLTFFDSVDCVILEMNDAVLSRYSDGFAEYLDNFLDDYIYNVPILKENTVWDSTTIVGFNEGQEYRKIFTIYKDMKLKRIDFCTITWNNKYNDENTLFIELLDSSGNIVLQKNIDCTNFKDGGTFFLDLADDNIQLYKNKEYVLTFKSNLTKQDLPFALKQSPNDKSVATSIWGRE